jgi:hypothetical protein
MFRAAFHHQEIPMMTLIQSIVVPSVVMLAMPPAALPPGAGSAAVAPIAPDSRAVDLAICLDTSGSMSGLIDAARQKLWSIANDLAMAKPAPRLRVALLTFGNDGHRAEDGWVRLETPLTDDLDLVSQKLFALTTNGGTELVGRVLSRAGGVLDWTPSDSALKLIIVAGNEEADQDQVVRFEDACREVIGRGIMVNSIYCGPATDPIAPRWQQVAQLADGHFACIDQNQGTVVIATPFDAELAALSTAINTTYLPFGSRGQEGALNQTMQDQNAASLNTAAAAERCATKASALYACTWDLVDACRTGQVKLEEIPVNDLPEAMRSMSLDDRRAHMGEMDRRRAELQQQVHDLTTRRAQFIAEESARQSADDSRSFDAAVRRAVRAQAASKGFSFAEPAPTPASPSSDAAQAPGS